MEKRYIREGQGFDFSPFYLEIIPKKIRHIYFRVYPSLKKIGISVPLNLRPDQLDRAILEKKNWLLKQIHKAQQAAHSPQNEYFSLNRLLYKGVAYHINIVSTDHPANEISIEEGFLALYLKKPYPKKQCTLLVEKWLRQQLLNSIGRLVDIWETKLAVNVSEYRLRKMKTRWGSCNVKVGRIWLNLFLIHLPEHFLEYVVVHEMVHLIERKHNSRFKAMMDKWLPQWRLLKEEMNRIPLYY